MRRTHQGLLAAALVVVLLTGCAAAMSPVTGTIYTDVKGPLGATANGNSTKVGTAIATSILGIIATGDASIETAMKNGGITKVSHIDYHSTGILGLYATFTVTVYGE